MSSKDEKDPHDTPASALTDDRTLENGKSFGITDSDSNNNQGFPSVHTPNGASSHSADIPNGSAISPRASGDPGVVCDPTLRPRQDHLTWEEYFMFLAFLSAQRSKDPVSQVGACIVNERNQIVGIGYNGMPRGFSNESKRWGKKNATPEKSKKMYVCHAELNAILNKNSADVSGCSIYVVLFPCNECAKLIIQAGINKIVYFSDKHKDKPSTIVSKKMLDMTRVKHRPFVVWGLRKLTLNFNPVKAVLPGSDLSGDAPDESADKGSAIDSPEGRPVVGDDSMAQPLSTESPRTLDQYISWEEYFMAVAFLSARRSKDPLSQAGACIVNEDKRIVATGYNGLPCRYPDENMLEDTEDNKKDYMCHAELAAIMNKNGADVRGCTMHVTLFPCNECAKLISQAGLKEVVYYEKKDDSSDAKDGMKASELILSEAKVTVTHYKLNEENRTLIPIDFNSING